MESVVYYTHREKRLTQSNICNPYTEIYFLDCDSECEAVSIIKLSVAGEGWEAEELTQGSRDASRAAEDELSCSAACRPPNILQEPGGEYELFITRPRAPDSRGWHERSDPSFITALFYDSHIRSNLILFH